MQAFPTISRTTKIFVLDSVSGNHEEIFACLTSYLRNESQHKKGLQVSLSTAEYHAIVLQRSNSSDCGMYTLHFFKTFLTDPKRYKSLIEVGFAYI